MGRPLKAKKIPKIKEPVRIRFKQLANGNQSIYLDYYLEGKREYEFLKLYIIPEKTPLDKESNKKTLSLANAIKAKRIQDIQNEAHGFKRKVSKKVNLITYIEEIANKQLEKTGNRRSMYHSLLSLIRHIKSYSGPKTTFTQIDEDYLYGFISYLRTAKNKAVKKNAVTISQNTKHKLYNRLSYILSIAERDGIIQYNPANKIPSSEKPRMAESKREYLTISELKQLMKTECKHQHLKAAFLFCSLTGLRYSDAKRT